ncbi:MAG TPA: hypothetical protein VIS06_08770 [Mycobacteriales bacterium]
MAGPDFVRVVERRPPRSSTGWDWTDSLTRPTSVGGPFGPGRVVAGATD